MSTTTELIPTMKSLNQSRLAYLAHGVLLLSFLASPLFAPPAAIAVEQTVAQAPVQQRLRIAILDFDFASTGLTGGAFSFADGGGPGQGISNLLTNRMVQDGTFSIIERSQIAAVLREQNLGASGRIDASTAAEIGRILGVDAVVVGSVTRFNLEERQSGVSIFGFGNSRRRYIAEVEVTARMIDTTTAEILAVAEGSGVSEARGNNTSLGLVTFGSDSNGSDRLLSEASEQAVDALVTQLAER
jgi:curli biogenesis system outer membrane secretion channel CsgG